MCLAVIALDGKTKFIVQDCFKNDDVYKRTEILKNNIQKIARDEYEKRNQSDLANVIGGWNRGW